MKCTTLSWNTLSHQKAVKDDWGYVRKNLGLKPEDMQLVRRDSGSINKGDNFHGLKKMSYVFEIHDFKMIPPTQINKTPWSLLEDSQA